MAKAPPAFLKKFENSKADKAADKKKGAPKEGSKKEEAMDAKGAKGFTPGKKGVNPFAKK